jgi:hypothetical protein
MQFSVQNKIIEKKTVHVRVIVPAVAICEGEGGISNCIGNIVH